MGTRRFPELDPDAIKATRDALHACCRVMGGWLKNTRRRRKHWWHASLRSSLTGLTAVELPAGTAWNSEGFSGAVLLYKDLVAVDDPAAYLQDMWSRLYSAGRAHLATKD